jgi:hypothetical protein
MRKVLLIAAAIVFVSGSASAIPPPIGYIGIFKDATHDIGWGGVCPAQYAQFHAWIWCLPGENGFMAAEFAVSFPATAVEQYHVMNPGITVELGSSLAAGTQLAFGEGLCQVDWVWLYDITLVLLNGAYSEIRIVPHPDVLPIPAYQAATCELGYPIEPLLNLTPLYICPAWDVEESSWGKIKSLF